MKDRDVLKSYYFGHCIVKLKVNLFFVGILLILGMLLFPLQVQAEKKKGPGYRCGQGIGYRSGERSRF